jgi:hypothetical protein
MMFLYASVMAFQLGKWEIGSAVFRWVLAALDKAGWMGRRAHRVD